MTRTAKKVKVLTHCPINGCWQPLSTKWLAVSTGEVEIITCSDRACNWGGGTTGRTR